MDISFNQIPASLNKKMLHSERVPIITANLKQQHYHYNFAKTPGSTICHHRYPQSQITAPGVPKSSSTWSTKTPSNLNLRSRWFHCSVQKTNYAINKISRNYCRAPILISQYPNQHHRTAANWKDYANVQHLKLKSTSTRSTARQRTIKNTLPCNNPHQNNDNKTYRPAATLK